MEVMMLRARMWFRSLLALASGGTARRDAEWKHLIRVEAGRKSWETRRAREAQKRAEALLDRRENFDLYDDCESDAVPSA